MKGLLTRINLSGRIPLPACMFKRIKISSALWFWDAKPTLISGILKGTFLLCVLLCSACGPFYYQPLNEDRNAALGPETPMKRSLLDLPEPKEPIVVAVYKFRDQTGQYKPTSSGSSWSTAVTQGATNILIRALEESGWFVPIERENISNLLNERKIIRSSREQYEGKSGAVLPPLLFAGVLLEGGIVSYETNIYTGGAGVRYFGTDVSAQYREDRVSIYLRAVSTSNGKVLKTIYTTKSILSQEVSAGVFRYVKYQRLLEAETGYTFNEPTDMAVTEAVEKAVHSLIIEGVLDNLWSLKDDNAIEDSVFANYEQEKQDKMEVDYIGQPVNDKYRTKVSASVEGAGGMYFGDYARSTMYPGLTLGMAGSIHKSLYIEGVAGLQYVKVENLMVSRESYVGTNLLFLAHPKGRVSPYLKLGAGMYISGSDGVGFSGQHMIPYVSCHAGLDVMLTKNIGLVGGMYLHNFLNDYFDGSATGSFNDNIWGFKAGLKIYW